MRSQHRNMFSLSCHSYQPETFQQIKKCFVCGKVSCCSSNYTQKECDELKKKFSDRYPEFKTRPNYKQNFQHWITEYKGVDDNEDIAYYFENLLINIDNNCTPGIESFYTNFKQFHTSIGQLHNSKSLIVVNTLANNAFKH